MLKLTNKKVVFIKQLEEIHPKLAEWAYEQLKFCSIEEIKKHIKHVMCNTKMW